MARTNNLSNFLTDVAGAIKEKKGSETAIPAANFDTEIRNLPSQGTYQHKTVPVTQNGTQTVIPDAGYDAIDELTINTAVPEKQLQTKTYNFTQNATLELTPDSGYDGFNQVNLNINVAGGEVNNQDKTITENGVYTADQGYTGIGTATVNVPVPQNMSVNIPASVTVDMFDDSTRLNVPLFVLPSNIPNITVAGLFYGKYSSEDEWGTGSVNGSVYVTEGTLSKAVYMDINSYWSSYGKLRVILVADGYNTVVQDIMLTKVNHNYGIIELHIGDWSYNQVINSMQWTFTNLDTGETVQPISITQVPSDSECILRIALPGGATYQIDMTVMGVSIDSVTSWVSNNEMNLLWTYPAPLPGFTWQSTPIIVIRSTGNTASALCTGTIVVYDDQDTVLHTENISLTLNESMITYTYVGEGMDHYTVTLNCWQTGETWTQTYTETMNSSIEFEANDYFLTIQSIVIDGAISTENATTLISELGLTFQEIDPVTEQVVKNASYYAYNDQFNNYASVLVKWDTANKCQISVTDADYEPSSITFNEGYGIGTQLQVTTKQPTITIEITLLDIDNNRLPYADHANYSFLIGGSRIGGTQNPIISYNIVDDGDGYAQLVTNVTRNMGDITCILGDNTFVKPELLVASYDVINQYDADTTISTTLQLPCTINSNYRCVAIHTETIEGFSLNNVISDVYDKVYESLNPSNTYNWIELEDAYELSKITYVIKIPTHTEVVFSNIDHLVDVNNLDYYVRDVELDIDSTTNYATFSYISDPLIVNNTAMFPRVAVWQYVGGPQADASVDGMYKMDVYQNGTLVNTNDRLGGVYGCPLSFSLNDVVEFRMYRNENTVETPQWSQTYYTLQTTTITEINKLYPLKVISIEEADANIDGNVPYINKHVKDVILSTEYNHNVPIVTRNETIDLFTAPIVVRNPENENITEYVSIVGGFYSLYGTDVDPSDYGTAYDATHDESIYTGPSALYTGDMNTPCMVSVSATDIYNFMVSAPGIGVRLTPNIPFCNTNHTYSGLTIHDCIFYENGNDIDLEFSIINDSSSSFTLEVVQLDIVDNSNNILASTTITLPDLGPGGFTTVGKTITDNISINDIYNFTMTALNQGGNIQIPPM